MSDNPIDPRMQAAAQEIAEFIYDCEPDEWTTADVAQIIAKHSSAPAMCAAFNRTVCLLERSHDALCRYRKCVEDGQDEGPAIFACDFASKMGLENHLKKVATFLEEPEARAALALTEKGSSNVG